LAYALRQWYYIVGSLGATVQVLAGWWDVYSHLLLGPVDPWWNPAHLTLYTGFAITILAVWRGLRIPRTQSISAVSPIRFENVAGLKLAGAGTVVEVVAGVWNEIVHHVFQSEPRITPAHALLIVGMLIVAFGMIIGLTIEYGMITHQLLAVSTFNRWLTLVCVVLTFASIWLAAGGALIYLAGLFRVSPFNWINAVLLALVATLILVPAKRVLPKFCSALVIGIIFNVVSYFFLVVYIGETPYIPWGLLPLAMFDLLVLGLNRATKITSSVLLSSNVTGLLFWATYYPFTSYLFPWSFSFQLQLVPVFLGGLAGAILGNRIYARLSSAVLAGVTG
jgi:hypothetical protein